MPLDIIGLIGVRGSGKDYTAQQIKEQSDSNYLIEKMAYADPLREHVFQMLGLSEVIGDNPGQISYEDFKKEYYSYKGLTKTGRGWLEDEGNLFTRKDLFCFVKKIQEKIKSSKSELIILTDVRLGREVYSLKYLGLLEDINIRFFFCDYKSDRYDDKETQSNELALSLRDKGYTDLQEVTESFN